MHTMKSFDEIKKKWLKDPEFKREYDTLEPEFQAIQKILDLRLKKNFSQKEIAEKMGTTQSAISRFEQGYVEPTLNFLSRLAKVFDRRLVIDFQ